MRVPEHRPIRARRSWPAIAIVTAALLSVPAVAIATHVFTDVPDGSTHADGIHYVADAGITRGCTATEFCPGASLTRGQMGTFLYKASGNDPATPPSVNADRLRGQTPAQLRSNINAAQLQGFGAAAFAQAGDVPQVETVTDHASCIGTGFMPNNSSPVAYGTVSNHGRFLTGGGSASGLSCPVSLPHGARITGASFTVGDDSPHHGVVAVRVTRHSLTSTAQNTIGAVNDVTTAAGTPGVVTVNVPIDPALTTVNTATHGYLLTALVGSSAPASSQYVYVVAGRVTYEIDRLVAP